MPSQQHTVWCQEMAHVSTSWNIFWLIFLIFFNGNLPPGQIALTAYLELLQLKLNEFSSPGIIIQHENWESNEFLMITFGARPLSQIRFHLPLTWGQPSDLCLPSWDRFRNIFEKFLLEMIPGLQRSVTNHNCESTCYALWDVCQQLMFLFPR